FLTGMAKVGGRFVILLDVDQVLRLDEVGSHEQPRADAAEPAVA
ncbi:chemotaxis protein CheW, partial [Rubrivivax gelatinosus]|nr:chemotaxis protein CheW [Rubrivivax gelatinosus]